MHGGHHVAQKLINVSRDLALARRVFNSGALTSCRSIGVSAGDASAVAGVVPSSCLTGHPTPPFPAPNCPGGRNVIDGRAQVMACDAVWGEVVVDPPNVAKREAGIEHKRLRQDCDAERGRRRLGSAVIQIRVVQMPRRGTSGHPRQIVGDIGIRKVLIENGPWTVRVDRHKDGTTGTILRADLLNPRFVEFGDRTMVAREDDDQGGIASVVVQRMHLAVGARQREHRCLRTNRQGWAHTSAASRVERRPHAHEQQRQRIPG